MGDCIYDYSKSGQPLLSNHFCHFGEEARVIQKELKGIIKKSQGHLKIESQELVDNFLKWIKKFKKNKIYADPQQRYVFDLTPTDDQIIKCSINHLKEDRNEKEEII